MEVVNALRDSEAVKRRMACFDSLRSRERATSMEHRFRERYWNNLHTNFRVGVTLTDDGKLDVVLVHLALETLPHGQ